MCCICANYPLPVLFCLLTRRRSRVIYVWYINCSPLFSSPDNIPICLLFDVLRSCCFFPFPSNMLTQTRKSHLSRYFPPKCKVGLISSAEYCFFLLVVMCEPTWLV